MLREQAIEEHEPDRAGTQAHGDDRALREVTAARVLMINCQVLSKRSR